MENFKNKPIPEGIHFREYIVSKVKSKEFMLKRWKEINYTPKNIQLKLEI